MPLGGNRNDAPPADHPIRDDFALESVFARAYALSLGKSNGATRQQMAQNV